MSRNIFIRAFSGVIPLTAPYQRPISSRLTFIPRTRFMTTKASSSMPKHTSKSTPTPMPTPTPTPSASVSSSSSPSPPQGKIKQFTKKYGPMGVSVYFALSVIDLSLTMAVISVKGADQAKQAEEWVLQKVKGWLGMSHTPSKIEKGEPSFGSLFVIAYGIHKTILLPIRLSLTAAITPIVAKRFKQWGLQKASKQVK